MVEQWLRLIINKVFEEPRPLSEPATTRLRLDNDRESGQGGNSTWGRLRAP